MENPNIRKRGRRRLNYEEKSAKSKRDEITDIAKLFLQKYSREEVTKAVLKYFKDSESTTDKQLSKVIKFLLNNPEKTDDTLNFTKSKSPKIKKLDPVAALGIILDFNLTRHQYDGMKEKINNCGAKIFPGYDSVLKAKKTCRPPSHSVTITETLASVGLTPLLKHTVERIIEANKPSILNTMMATKTKNDRCTLIVPWGFDGSTGQGNYKQGYKNETGKTQMDDSSLFATTLVPQRLIGSKGVLYWQNPCPQSVRFCRPIRLQFAKETPELVLAEKLRVEKEIATLPIIPIKFANDYCLSIKFELCLSIIDGKILNIITNTKSTSSCPICGSSSKDFNILANLNASKFKPIDGRLKHGISPTHCWIRSFEFLFTLACKLEFEQWQARGENKTKCAERKTLLRDRFWFDMGLRVFLPNSNGSGSSNDGNTARRAFKDYAKFADILELDEDVVKGLRTLLIALNCQLPLDVGRYNSFCDTWFKNYVDKYGWNYLTPTVHKIIIHGGQIIQASSVPVGLLGEEASEAKNKIYKKDRECHARKMSRELTMHDVFYRSIDASDPLISTNSFSIRTKFKKKIPLPIEVINLLVPSVEISVVNDQEAENTFDQFLDDENLILEVEDDLNL